MNKLMIVGAGGHGHVIADAASKMDYQEIAFLDDAPPSQGTQYPIVGGVQAVNQYISEWDIVVAVGNQNIREKLLNEIEQMGAKLPVIIDGSVTVGSNVRIGVGTVILPGAVINYGARIGRGCIVNTGATVDHDGVLEDFVHLSPGVHLAGGVHIGARSWLGVASAVINHCSITADCMIGAGAIVCRDITEPGTYIGVPARKRE